MSRARNVADIIKQPFVTTLPGKDFYQSWLKAQKKL